MWFFVFDIIDEERLYPVKCTIILFDFILSQCYTVKFSVLTGVVVDCSFLALPWLFWDIYVLHFVWFIHTQVAHRKLFWTINKVNRRQKWVTCSSRHWMACANKAKGWLRECTFGCSKLFLCLVSRWSGWLCTEKGIWHKHELSSAHRPTHTIIDRFHIELNCVIDNRHIVGGNLDPFDG